MNEAQVNVIGLGYIGLPTAAVLAHSGFTVHGLDIDSNKINQLNSGINPIHEPELDGLLQEAVSQGLLSAGHTPRPARVHIIAVPTPRHAAHTPDLSYIKQAVVTLSEVVRPGDLVLLESTSPVGTTEEVSQWLQSLRPDLNLSLPEPDVGIVYCPERVLPGQIIHELKINDRILGGLSKACSEQARRFYESFIQGKCHITDARTAEIAKLTENAFRDINIAFANELSMICDKLSVNVWELIDLVNHHPRVNLLNPGPGVGGHCIAVDPWFIVNSAPEESRLVRTAREVNDSKPAFVLRKIHEKVMETNDAHIACLGLTFKANASDLRESPALHIVKSLAETYGKVDIVEPHIRRLPADLAVHPGVSLVPLDEAWSRSNVIALLVDHDSFRELYEYSFDSKAVIDTRGFFYGRQIAAVEAPLA